MHPKSITERIRDAMKTHVDVRDLVDRFETADHARACAEGDVDRLRRELERAEEQAAIRRGVETRAWNKLCTRVDAITYLDDTGVPL